MSAHDGGPAFPCTDEGKREEGMSLRDYFAAHLVAAGCVGMTLGNRTQAERAPLFVITATVAYEIADAMLKAREGK